MKIALSILLSLCASLAMAQSPRQDPAALRQLAEQFLAGQTAGLPGTVSITVGAAPSISPASQTLSGRVGTAITATSPLTGTNFTGSLTALEI